MMGQRLKSECDKWLKQREGLKGLKGLKGPKGLKGLKGLKGRCCRYLTGD